MRADELALTSRNGSIEAQEPARSEIVDWIRRARAGDEQAFARLVERHERMVLRTALRLLGRMEDAQDAAQETFLRMHRYLGRFDEAREVGPWLYRVVVNVCHDLARRAAANLVALDEAREAPDSASRFGPEAIEAGVSRSQQRRLVEAALTTLPEKERAAVVLRDIEGLETAEVARILGSSEGTVRSQVCTARLKIRQFVARARRRP